MSDRLLVPDEERFARWAGNIGTDYLHHKGWRQANRRLHTITSTARTFANKQYGSDDLVRKAAFLDGVSFVLGGLMHSTDVDELATLFHEGFEPTTSPKTPLL